MWQRDQHSPGGIRQISISRVSNNSLSWILLGDVLCFFGIGPQRLLQHPKWLSRISQIDSRQYFLPEKMKETHGGTHCKQQYLAVPS